VPAWRLGEVVPHDPGHARVRLAGDASAGDASAGDASGADASGADDTGG
jgi:hypothetical protein